MRAVAVLALCVMGLLVSPVRAQVSDVQRCVWACLAQHGHGAAYDACVGRSCVADAPTVLTPVDPTRQWQHGQTNDGTLFAGIDVPGFAGKRGVYWFCRPGAPAYFQLVGMTGQVGPYFGVDAVVFQLPFTIGVSGQMQAVVPVSDPMIAALRSAGTLRLYGVDGQPAHDLALSGARAALDHVMRNC